MEFTIPIADQEVSTDDGAGDAAGSVVAALVSFLALFGVVGAASYVYNRMKDVAGVDGETEIPGV